MTDYRRLRVALLGAGAVGSQVADLHRVLSTSVYTLIDLLIAP